MDVDRRQMERAIQSRLGPEKYRLLQSRLTHARKAMDTLAEIAPELVADFRAQAWRGRVPADMAPLFEQLFDRFDATNLEPQVRAMTRADRRALLSLVRGFGAGRDDR